MPNDLQLTEVPDAPVRPPRPAFDPIDSDAIERAATMLKSGKRSALIIGGRALRQDGLRAAVRLRAAVGCDLLTDGFPAYVERGEGLPAVKRIPYFPEAALEVLSRYEAFVLIGVREPVTFFGYPGMPGRLLTEQQQRVSIWADGQDEVTALEGLADALDAPPLSRISPGLLAGFKRPLVPSGALTPEKIGATLAALQPEDAIIVDEGLTTSFGYHGLSSGVPHHSLMAITGGAIGYGMPCAVGAALAAPARKVVNLQASSALYTVQALWTQAREGLNITTLICSNRRYHTLEVELARMGMSAPGPAGRGLTSLSAPTIDWVEIARGFGVPAVSIDTIEGLARELARSVEEPGPHLIEMRL